MPGKLLDQGLNKRLSTLEKGEKPNQHACIEYMPPHTWKKSFERWAVEKSGDCLQTGKCPAFAGMSALEILCPATAEIGLKGEVM